MKTIIGCLIVVLLFLKVDVVSANSIDNHDEYRDDNINHQTIDDYSIIKSTLSLYEVPENQQVQLINKLMQGVEWDSLKETAEPITISRMVIDGVVENVERYADGSIVATSVDLEHAKKIDSTIPLETNQFIPNDNDISSNAISIGGVKKSSHSTTYTNAKVYHNTVLVNASFYANFTLVRSGYGKINSVYTPKVSVFGPGASVSNRKLVINRRSQNASNSAMATLTFNYKTNYSSSNAYLRLLVGKNYSTTYYY